MGRKVLGRCASHNNIRKDSKNRSRQFKRRPANEITEEEVRAVLEAVKNYPGYPKLRELAKLVPILEPFKLNLVIRFLERSGTILIDGDGYIVWIRATDREQSTFGDIAEFSPEFRRLIGRSKE